MTLFWGIDISDDLVTGVTVSRNGKESNAVACAFCQLDEENQLSEQLPLLLEELQYSGKGRCDIGLGLSQLSLRNITLPFTDSKKIEQILPFELDEQLLLPADQHIITTNPAMVDEEKGETQLVAAALEKERMARHLSVFREQGVEPNKICPTDFVLAECLSQTDQESENFIVLSCATSAATIAIVQHGAVAFMRELPYPTEVFTETLFSFDGKEIHTDDPDKAEQAVKQICHTVEQSIDIFTYQFSNNLQPDYILLTGSMLLDQGFQKKVASELGLPVKQSDLVRIDTVTLTADIAGQWKPELFDRPLALALQAAKAGRKATSFNFRKDEFSLPHYLLGSKKQLIGAAATVGGFILLTLGYLFGDVHQLEKKHDRLSTQMTQVFQQSFPGIRPSGDPLLHMRSKLQGMDTMSVSMPIFSEEKRVLFVLYDISARIPETLDLHITRLIIDQDSVKMTGTTDAFKNVNTIKSLLTASDRYAAVNIVSATNGKQGEGIRFEIKLQLNSAEGEEHTS
ncbi:type II secretion system protein GspL [Candidatus Electrothrix sp.]|uniref:type II secretion system protein GspL n=1 Tax=Candidatus Electrothrix sp. TaxID=2170559 RepID=UPI004055E48F